QTRDCRSALHRHPHWRCLGRASPAQGAGQRSTAGHAGRVVLPRRLQPERPAPASAPFGAAVRNRRPASGADRRRVDERPHHSRRPQRTVRLRSPGQRDAGLPAGPGCWRVADSAECGRRNLVAGRPRTREADRPRAAGPRNAKSFHCLRRPLAALFQESFAMTPLHAKRPLQLNHQGQLRHFLSLDGLPRELLTEILDTADSFLEVGARAVKKVPLLRGKTVCNVFFENSTRTRTTFELAAKRLSADVITLNVSTSSTSKGETLTDTLRNLEAMAADMFVVRHAD